MKYLLILSLLTSTAYADEVTCKKVLHDCDAAVTSLQKETQLQKQIISDEDARYNEEHKELKDSEIWKPIALGGIAAALLEGLLLTFRH